MVELMDVWRCTQVVADRREAAGRTDNEIRTTGTRTSARSSSPRASTADAHAARRCPGKMAAAPGKTTATPAVVPPQPPPMPVLPTSSAAATGCDSPADGGNDDLAATMSLDTDGFEGFGDQLLADYAASAEASRTSWGVQWWTTTPSPRSSIP
ncbi:hypothetical protein ZWY2020_057511 [Hordeum vulgare]|nr:hypothetical protein ZWY2020_057511 [Hordeum vulgare]